MSDIVERLVDLHKQATEERSHFYTGKCIRDAIAEITRLREALSFVLDESDEMINALYGGELPCSSEQSEKWANARAALSKARGE